MTTIMIHDLNHKLSRGREIQPPLIWRRPAVQNHGNAKFQIGGRTNAQANLARVLFDCSDND
jgi:hypothetical protein